MLEKDKFLEKTNFLIFFIIIVFSQTLVAETTIKQILKYNSNLQNSSASFIQSDGINIQEGEFFFGSDRIKIDYKKPQILTIILSEKKGAYINHELQEVEYFNTEKTYIRFFLKILKGTEFTKNIKITDSLIEFNDNFVLNDVFFKIKILYENNPIKIRKVVILEDDEILEISFFDHNNLKLFEKNFFSMVNPYIN